MRENPRAMRIGVDLGGTKIEAIALGDDGRELARRRVPTPRHDYDATLGAIVSLVSGIEQETGHEGSVGVGMPGALSPASGLVKNANSTWLIGRAIDRGPGASARPAGALRQRRQLLRALRGDRRRGRRARASCSA